MDYFSFIIFVCVYYIYLGFNDIINKNVIDKKPENRYVMDRIEELKQKKNKTYEEQLEYLKLKNSGLKNINIPYSFFIKIFILITLFMLIQNRIIIYSLLYSYSIITRLMGVKKEKAGKFLDLCTDVISITIMLIIIRMVSLTNIFVVLFGLFGTTFIFNITLKQIGVKNDINC